MQLLIIATENATQLHCTMRFDEFIIKSGTTTEMLTFESLYNSLTSN